MKSALELADSALELYSANPVKIGVWVRAFTEKSLI